VPALPSSILEPLWVQVSALLPDRPVHHPLGCHRPRIPDRPPMTTYWRWPEAMVCLAGRVPEERRAVDPANLRSYS
jgi:hypothetical protein